jgi:hypothetical protein
MAGKSGLLLQSPNPASDDAPACVTSVTIQLKSVLGPRMDPLRESKQGSLPTTGPYPKYRTGVLLFPGVDVQIFHGRLDGQYAVQVSSPYAISAYQVDLCRKQLFADAHNVRINCLEISFKVRDSYIGGNGNSGSASSARPLQEGKRATPYFRRNAVGHAWCAEWDAVAHILHVRVVPDRSFLNGCGIATLRDVVGLRGLNLGALLASDDICKLPVPWNFSKSREVLTDRLAGMLRELCF